MAGGLRELFGLLSLLGRVGCFGFRGLKGSGLRGFKGLGFRGCKGLGFRGFKGLGFRGFKGLGTSPKISCPHRMLAANSKIHISKLYLARPDPRIQI